MPEPQQKVEELREAESRVAEAEQLVTRLELLISHTSQFGGDVEQAKASLAAMRHVLGKLHEDREQLLRNLDVKQGTSQAGQV